MTDPNASAPTTRIALVHWLVVWLTAACVALLVSDYARVPIEPIAEGDVAERTVKAPFSYSYQDVDAFGDARARAEAAASPVFLYDEGMLPEVSQRVSLALEAARAAVTPEVDDEGEVVTEITAAQRREAQDAFVAAIGVPLSSRDVRTIAESGYDAEIGTTVTTWLTAAYGERLVVADRGQLPTDGRALTIVPRVGDRAPFSVASYERVVEPEGVEEAITLAAVRDRRKMPWTDAAEAIALASVKPNLVFDEGRTEDARRDAVARVEPEVITVKRGETLFREGDKVTADGVLRYEALQAARSEHGVINEVITAFCFMLMLLGAVFIAARAKFEGRDGLRDLAAVCGSVIFTLVLARIVVASSPGIAALIGDDASPSSVWFLVPVAGVTALVRELMGLRLSAMYALVASGAAALLMDLHALYVVYFVLTSLVAATTVGRMRERLAVLGAGAITGLFGALLALVLHFVELYIGNGELSTATAWRPLYSMGFAILGGLLSGFVVLGVMPIFEAAGFVTDHRLLELASLNHPLMRQLMLRAPGTYHHSVVVGTLAEAACESIGADSLQAKIAAYFHDIGKALEPRYFVENQRGGSNPHNKIGPEDSARIIIAHVTEGARLAREHKLPRPILDNILMHHGSGLLQYFYAQAMADAEDPADVDESTFRYPGPKPSTREAGVIMLADKVEAATRTIQNPTEENIRAMINRIINSVIADHQFTECPLTFQEIHTIADTFVSVLLGIYHQRIEYPQTAGISRSQAATVPAGEPGKIAGAPGTITLELEARALAVDQGAHLWNDEGELTDETTDYESVQNLPRGDL